MNENISKSWFCVFNNPEEHGFKGTPEEIVNKIIEMWIEGNPQRTCAVSYCISAEGLKHCHAVLEDTKAMRFTIPKKLYSFMHIEPTKGNKQDAEDYISKRGKFKETGEKIVYINRQGEIKGFQGKRNDLEILEELINGDKTPNEIMDLSLSYRRYEKLIRDAYYRKRYIETPIKREISVFWHVGASGTGKSFTEIKLSEKYGADRIYKISEYENGFADKYNGEPILFADEFRGQLKYSQILTILDCYRNQIHARYSNIVGLWNEVHITSVYPPDILYEDMIQGNRSIDTYEQLKRRISFMVYHYKQDGCFFTYEIPMEQYIDYKTLRHEAEQQHNKQLELLD